MKCKYGGSYVYKNKKYRRLEIEKKNISFFISEIPHFCYMLFFRKCSMFHLSIPLRKAKVANFTDIIKIASMFIIGTFKDSIKLKEL